MKITKYIHSCIEIEKESDKILFDPGLFTFVEGEVKPSQFQDIQAIILTHNHPDHIDTDSLKEIIKQNPDSKVLANSEIIKKLAEKDIEGEIFESGERTIGGYNIKAFDAPHEAILADELPQNTAYLIDDQLLHPGDSLSKNLYSLKGTPLLFLPIMAPWCTELQVYDFAMKLAPKNIIPIHDGYAKDFFLKSRYENFQKYFSKENMEFQWMDKAGTFFEL